MRQVRRLVLIAATLSLMCAAGAEAATSPSDTTGAVTSITTDGGLLHGTVNPNGSSTTAHFEWGLTTSYGVASSNIDAGGGSKPVPVQFTVTGLLPGTLYHYRLDAVNRFGTAYGIDRTFTTAGNPPPDAATGPATSIGTSTATLTGVINPHNEQTSWAFQYGLDTGYGVQTYGGIAAAGSAAVTVSEQLRGLEPGTLFHYRVVAYHGPNAVTGADGSFYTEPSPRPVPSLAVKIKTGKLKKKPFDFAVTGSVKNPSSFPASLTCTGTVTVSTLLGRRALVTVAAPVAADCTFAALMSVKRVPGLNKRHPTAKLQIVSTFAGNGFLAPAANVSRLYRVG